MANLKKTKYPTVDFVCPVCTKLFKTKLGSKKEKKTCSYACANKYFRSGENNGMFKHKQNYVTICFLKHKKECIICKEDKIVAVHHFDLNHENNDVCNLIPLCPTHHCYVHSSHYSLIKEKIEEYIKIFKENNLRDNDV